MMGDIFTIRKPLARLRIHGPSWGSMMESLSTVKVRQLLGQDVERAHLFATVSRQLRVPVSDDPLKHSFTICNIDSRPI